MSRGTCRSSPIAGTVNQRSAAAPEPNTSSAWAATAINLSNRSPWAGFKWADGSCSQRRKVRSEMSSARHTSGRFCRSGARRAASSNSLSVILVPGTAKDSVESPDGESRWSARCAKASSAVVDDSRATFIFMVLGLCWLLPSPMRPREALPVSSKQGGGKTSLPTEAGTDLGSSPVWALGEASLGRLGDSTPTRASEVPSSDVTWSPPIAHCSLGVSTDNQTDR